MKSKKKYYEILSAKRKYRYGIFPFTEKGREEADKYLEKLRKLHSEEFLIREK